MTMKRHRTCARLLAAIVLGGVGTMSYAATPAQVDAALTKGKEYLYSQQKNGNWETVAQPDPAETAQSDKNGQFTGRTALALYALLAAGESPQDPRIAQAIDFLRKNDTVGTYALSFRIQAFAFLPRTAENRAFVNKDARKLLDGIQSKGDSLGMWDYTVAGDKRRPTGYSHSRAQYGVLGLWQAEKMGVEIPGQVWQLFEREWIGRQNPAGAWSYTKSGQDATIFTPGMTAVGVATLFIAQDYTRASLGVDCRGNLPNPAIDKGLNWMRDNFARVAPDEPGPREFIYAALYAVERIGVSSGYKFFGDIDWFERGADYLIARQTKTSGAWGGGGSATVSNNFNNTCFAMLFLARGRAPVVMNKLDYSSEASKDTPWNQRSRDAANVTRWIGRETERDLNWQIVNLSAPTRDLHDAPILYVAGNKELTLPDAARAKLKQYIDEGGMILGNADCGGKAFATSFQKLGKEMFPGYEFRELPDDHPIYARQQYLRSNWRSKPLVLALSNGARELMILVPTADMGKVWQVEALGGREELWQLMGNIFLYAVDKTDLRVKGQTYLVDANPQIKPASTVKIGRLQYAGNWNPEPGGWKRLSNVMHNTMSVALDVSTIDLSKAATFTDHKILHLTGTGKFTLEQGARDAIAKFVNGGGTLIVDAAGGSTEFATSAERELLAIFPSGIPKRLPTDSPVYQSVDKPLENLTYRSFARRALGGERDPLVEAIDLSGRPAVLFSRQDLSTGLVGMPVDGIIGYSPDSATDLMSRMILHASGVKPVTPKPAAAPAKAK